MRNRLKIIAFTCICAGVLAGCNKTAGNEGRKNGSGEDNPDNESGSVKNYTNTSLPAAEYIQWIQDPENGFRKEKKINEIGFAVQYKPYEYIACMEEKKSGMPDSVLRKKITEMDGLQYYDLRIMLEKGEGELLKYNLGSSEQYNQRVKYFAFDMQRDIQLIEGNDTLPCVLYHFERTFDVAPYCTILLGFNMDKNKMYKQHTILVNDRIFNNGLLKFTYKENKLLNLPKLETI